ncbi:MAG: mannitol dehydrogenase family protein [Halieaceae bacterium]|nr:mannitol dehydrogenase family protein [Halieaceae bacterium]
MKICDANLGKLPTDIRRPTYDRSKLTPGIVHIGLGNFHRAHQSWYLHRLMEQGEAHDWAIIGAGVRPNDDAQRKLLAEQDYLTTLIELDPAGRSAEIVGSMIGFVPVEVDNAALIAQLSKSKIRIVSLTVTEGGYYIDPVSKQLDVNHPDIGHDTTNPDKPRTAFGAIVAGLKNRFENGLEPFTCQSCDNLQGNGSILRQTVVGLARLSNPELADWIDARCTFPNSMVDCIVPVTGPKELEMVRSLGISDAIPVTHENYRQWVIEDDFCAGRPEWNKVGATFTKDVHEFEAMKIRLLNGGHQLIANAGEVLSIEYISDCMDHHLIGDFFRKVAKEEIAHQVDAVPGMAPEAYVDLVDRRFSNAEIIDTVRRVAFDGSSRQTGFIVPTLKDALDKGTPMDGLALSQAVWARMCAGTREDGSIIKPNDPVWEKLNAEALASKIDPSVWLAQNDLYGDLSKNIPLKVRFEHWLALIWSEGLEAALRSYLTG